MIELFFLKISFFPHSRRNKNKKLCLPLDIEAMAQTPLIAPLISPLIVVLFLMSAQSAAFVPVLVPSTPAMPPRPAMRVLRDAK